MQREKIVNIQIGKRFREDMGDLEPLQASIAKLGLLHPVVITTDKILIAGERRILACKELGWKDIPVNVVDIEDLLEAERDENDETIRKSFTVSEKVAIGKAIEVQLGKRQGARNDAKSRKDVQPSSNGHSEKKSLTNGKTSDKTIAPQLVDARPQVEKGEKTRAVAAKAAGFDSDHSYRNAKRVQELGCKDLRDAVDDEVVTAFDAASICDSEHDIQAEAVRRVLHGVAKTLKAAVAAIDIERAARDEMDEPVQDCNGVNVPDNLREYFDSTPQFKLIESKAKELRTLLNALDKHPISQTRQRGQLQSYCRTIEGAMETERFGFVCPACEGHDGANCNCCDNRRWFKASDIGKVDLKKWRKGK